MNPLILTDIVPLTIAASASPTAVTLGILILSTKQRPQAKTLAYLLGNLLVLLLVGLAVLLLVKQVSQGHHPPSVQDDLIDVMVGMVLLYLGFKTIRKPQRRGTPKWFRGLDQMSLWRSFQIGVGIMVINISTLVTFMPAVRDISKLGFNLAGELAAMLLIIFVVELWILLPLVLTKVAPVKSRKILDEFMGFINRHSRTVTIAMCLGLGLYFAVKGALGIV